MSGDPGVYFSPLCRRIETMDGDAETALASSQHIVDVGEAMAASATLLKKVRDSQDGQQGKAIDKLRELVKDTADELEMAAALYTPTGEALVTYSQSAVDHECAFKTIDSKAGTAWAAYVNAPGDASKAGEEVKTDTDGNEDPAAAAAAAENDLKQELYEAYVVESTPFDPEYSDWSDAYQLAEQAVGEVLESSKLEDGWGDRFDVWIDKAQKILSIVGLVVGVLSLIIGGPILALIGSIIAVIALALTAYQFFRGDASGWALAMAIVGVIPVGKLGSLFKGKAGMKDMIPAAFSPQAWKAAGHQMKGLQLAHTFGGGGLRGLKDLPRQFVFGDTNPAGMKDLFMRVTTGRNLTDWTALADSMDDGIGVIGDLYSIMHGKMDHSLKIADYMARLTGNDRPKEVAPGLDILW